jgi:hypothetical protein
MTDAELAALGWDFATRDIHGGVVSVATADHGGVASQREEAIKARRTFIDLRPLVAPPTVPAPIHKTCCSCRTPKPLTAYHWRNRARGVRHSSCKACRCRDERTRYDGRNFLRECAERFGPRPLPAIAPTNPPLPWGYGMTPEDVAAVNEAAEDADPFPPSGYGMTPERAAAALKWLKDIQNIPATTPSSVVDRTTLNLPMCDPYWKTTAGYNPAHSDVWNYLSRAGLTPDPDPMGNGSAWGWVTVATVGALGVLVGLVAWVLV